jgi:hypothetical protein
MAANHKRPVKAVVAAISIDSFEFGPYLQSIDPIRVVRTGDMAKQPGSGHISKVSSESLTGLNTTFSKLSVGDSICLSNNA